ncbi:hypothetical protein ACFQ48_17810 [Hymenobacter caeli]|uniref:Small-conductance mechanosensitive channel n=1 Tax=Hymenobacter caeli TaxID=2735894 RepID=A0ABX2FVA7_9BACT|nr:hypothetical protein [Hymenobacter caeli]NRT20936.1 small-conductance mechanosensitive channel [Hymenobacter caeli]
MASNLDYLAPALEPLEDKVKAYLQAEEALRKAHQAAVNAPRQAADRAQAAAAFEQRPATGSFDQAADERQQQRTALRDDLDRLREEVIALLPARDAWVKVNLGYGPSRVGAWAVPGPPARYELRVVH